MCEVITYNIYECPLCKQKFLTKEEAEKCLNDCKKTFIKYYVCRMTLDLGLTETTAKYEILSKERHFHNKGELNLLLDDIRVFYHYDKIEFSAFCLTDESSQTEKAFKRLKEFVVKWLGEKAEFVKQSLVNL
jgi:hypothetical protein